MSIYLLSFVETPRKFIIAELSIRKLGSSSVLIILLIILLLALMKIRAYGSKALQYGVSTKLNKYIVFTMQTYKKLITVSIVSSLFICYHLFFLSFFLFLQYLLYPLIHCTLYKKQEIQISSSNSKEVQARIK